MKLTLSEIIEQFEDAFILQPMNELEIYQKWVPKLRQAYETDNTCACPQGSICEFFEKEKEICLYGKI